MIVFTLQSEDMPQLPDTECDILERAKQVGMPINEACMPGVIANMALLKRHAKTLFGNMESPQS